MYRKLLNNDCLDYLNQLNEQLDCCFADPPDNLGLKYDGLVDRIPHKLYIDWLQLVLKHVEKFNVFWFSFYHRYIPDIIPIVVKSNYNMRMYIWRFKFGQYSETDSPSGYRPILRISHPNWKPILTERVPSVREQIGDKRATGVGRIPDDVWDYSRIQGNNDERRSWHPTQHPQCLYSRIAKMSVPENGTFVDLFAGTGTAFRSIFHCNVIGVEQSRYYCDQISKEHDLQIQKL